MKTRPVTSQADCSQRIIANKIVELNIHVFLVVFEYMDSVNMILKPYRKGFRMEYIASEEDTVEKYPGFFFEQNSNVKFLCTQSSVITSLHTLSMETHQPSQTVLQNVYTIIRREIDIPDVPQLRANIHSENLLVPYYTHHMQLDWINSSQSVCCRSIMDFPSASFWSAERYVLEYWKDTAMNEIQYNRSGSPLILQGFRAAKYLSDILGRRSTSGCVLPIPGGDSCGNRSISQYQSNLLCRKAILLNRFLLLKEYCSKSF